MVLKPVELIYVRDADRSLHRTRNVRKLVSLINAHPEGDSYKKDSSHQGDRMPVLWRVVSVPLEGPSYSPTYGYYFLR